MFKLITIDSKKLIHLSEKRGKQSVRRESNGFWVGSAIILHTGLSVTKNGHSFLQAFSVEGGVGWGGIQLLLSYPNLILIFWSSIRVIKLNCI